MQQSSHLSQVRRVAFLFVLVFAMVAASQAVAVANVTSRGGPVELEPHVFPIFWGNAWNSGTPATERGKVMTMYEDLNSVGASWQSILTQYWTPKIEKGEEATPFEFISSSVVIGGYYLDLEEPPANVTPANMEAEIKKAIEAKNSQENKEHWPESISKTSVNDQFILFFPASTTWAEGHNKKACGEHKFHTGSYVFDWIAWESETSTGGMALCSPTVTGAHEYAEGVTDPYASGSGGWRLWGATKQEEIADICEEGERTEWGKGIEIPQLWDNSESKCTASHTSPPRKEPKLLANEATGISGTQATLHGSAELNGLEVESYRFEWGRTSVSEQTEAFNSAVNLKFGVSKILTGLERNKTYRFRLVLLPHLGPELHSPVETFITVPIPPMDTVEAPTGIEPGKAILHGCVNPKGFATKYRFEWGESPAYGHATEWKELSGSTSQAVEAPITGLNGEKTYYYRLFAESSEGHAEAKGEFVTPDWRPIVSSGPVNATTETATLKATINPNGFATEYHFDWGTQAEFEEGKYGHRAPAEGEVSIGSGTTNVEVSQPISGLEANKRYHFRVVATNSQGSHSEDRAFRSQPLFKRTFGGSGSGAGQLAEPRGVATDKEGNVWVADTAHNRVQEFNSKGEFVREFGALGSANGEFNSPRGIAINQASGNIYVADSGNSRIEEFNGKGEFIRKWGSEGTGNGQFVALQGLAIDPEGRVWTVEGGGYLGNNRVQKFSSEGAYLSQFGKEGTEAGQFKRPEAIATDAAGNVWIADTENNRVQEIKPSGIWVRTITGSGAEALWKPRGLAFDAEGKLWVADSGNDRLERFSPEGAYLAQLGAPGNNNSQLSEPRGLAIDGGGNIWVADTGNNRVQELTLIEFLRTFGGSGSGVGQLAEPRGVATDKEGNVWVADTAHNRVQEFNSKGEFVRQFGALGSANGEFNAPRGVAIDAKGNVWVVDTGNNRLQEFNSKGEFIRKFGSAGEENGQFQRPQAVTIDPEGHIWTIELGAVVFCKPRVQEFSSEGTFIRQFGSKGSGAGQFQEPQGIASDAAGNVWVADTGNNRIQGFKPSSEFIRSFMGSGSEALSRPRGLAFDAEGKLWVADTGNDRLERFSAEGAYLAQFGAPGNNNGQFSEPSAVAIDTTGNLWVADTANNRVQESTPTEFLRTFGGSGSSAGNLVAPRGVATDKEGNVWVADTAHNRVQEFSSEGKFIREFGALGSANGEFNSPRGLTISSAGNVYVADSANNRVQEFSSEGKFIRKWGSEGTGNGQFTALQGLAIDPEGHVWTIEGGGLLGNNRVQEFSAEGVYITQFGKEGSEAGQFRHPEGIAIDAAGNVWVADTENNRVQEFKPSGAWIQTLGSSGSEVGQLSGPRGLAFGSAGDLWVADTGNDRLEAFTSTGAYLVQFGSPGNNNGQVAEPMGIAVDTAGNLWAADAGNDRVQEWGS